MLMNKTLRITLCQMNIQVGDPEANLKKGAEWISRSAGQGSQLVLFPELWSTGYALERAVEFASVDGPKITARTSELARDHHIWVGGSTLETADDRVYNTFRLFAPDGRLAATYRKIHLFRLMQEDRWLAPGDATTLVDTDFGLAGLAICYDLRFPELFRGYALRGARLMLAPAEWPIERVGNWRILVRARAIENQVFVAAVNAAGDCGGTVMGGNSAVIGPRGEEICSAGADEALLTADLDLSMPEQARQKMDILRDRRPETYD
jgi:predicted amidohydrolase